MGEPKTALIETVPPAPPESPPPTAAVFLPSNAEPQTVLTEPMIAAPGVTPAVVPAVVMPFGVEAEGAAPGTIGSTDQGPVDGASPSAEPYTDARNMTRRSRTSILLLCLAAVAAVLTVFAVIHFISASRHDSGTSGTTATTGSTATTAVTRATGLTHPAPIPSAELADYETDAQALVQANTASARSLAGVGTAPTPADVAPVAATYSKAVNLYHLQLSLFTWPASMQSEVQTDEAELAILGSLLNSAASVAPTGVATWLTQLRQQGAQAEAADNAVRQDLGLSKTATFP